MGPKVASTQLKLAIDMPSVTPSTSASDSPVAARISDMPA